MKSILLILILAAIGIGAGAGAGMMLRPPPEEVVMNPCGEEGEMVESHPVAAPEPKDTTGEEADPNKEYVKLNNQFIVPIVEEGRVASMVVLSLSLEVELGQRETVYAREPKLRDSFLQVLFDHANSGGFSGNFTTGTKMRHLSEALEEIGRKVLGATLTDVLIIDIVRQDN
ncbi:flagellar basal body-associated FliL family protein [Vannielia litorea]|uniref:flagellar basal body-associated FliL family protein n=1 Tax=Vannielia TaxID=2813041 RepID=UPI001C947571|nr:flagellar basal body-associated FliL family protein [Vannielia litorea]MBY6048874.1 flagellar basal body-associated FliL family protein [Vannielia litorea]MBY6076288.1 flagellar basal body-associated FliL family protein [Vannielia litorea]MBY6154509.1 flagellar basal body-associated FliL family protein [Vannielia litorea]